MDQGFFAPGCRGVALLRFLSLLVIAVFLAVFGFDSVLDFAGGRSPGGSVQAQSSGSKAKLTGVNVLSLPDSSQVFLRLDREVTYRWGQMASPPRIYFELFATELGQAPRTEFAVEDPFLKAVRVVALEEGVLQVFFDLVEDRALEVKVVNEPPLMLIEVMPESEKPLDSPFVAPERSEEVPAEELASPPQNREASAKLVSPAPPVAEPLPSSERVVEEVPPVRSPREESNGLERIRVVSGSECTQVEIELKALVKPKAGRLTNPDRVYFDFEGTRISPSLESVIVASDGRLKQVRSAQFKPSVSRVVLDIQPGVSFRMKDSESSPRVTVELCK